LSATADTFIIFHDALSQWWEVEAQQYIKAKGFRDRQLRCLRNTNKGNRYEGKLTGDSPEICRGLDAHGFADLKLSMAYHTSLSSKYDKADPRRFGMGTPTAVWETMRRCWEVEPTPARIVEDISAFGRMLDVLIAHQGCVVPDEFLRSGRRYRRADDKAQEKLGDLANKPRNSQRKVTLKGRVCHADCEEARRLITNPGSVTEVEAAADVLLMLLDNNDDEEEDAAEAAEAAQEAEEAQAAEAAEAAEAAAAEMHGDADAEG
jgi:hypothetical protein